VADLEGELAASTARHDAPWLVSLAVREAEERPVKVRCAPNGNYIAVCMCTVSRHQYLRLFVVGLQ
jgi:hypothetical protein